MFKKTYAENLPALEGKQQWDIVDPGFKLSPPVQNKAAPGRPRKTRIKPTSEGKGLGPRKRKCKRCGGLGHLLKTCKKAIDPAFGEEDAHWGADNAEEDPPNQNADLHDKQQEEEEAYSEDEAPVQPAGEDEAPVQPAGADDAPVQPAGAQDAPVEPHSETNETATQASTVQSTPRKNYKKAAERGASPMAISKKRKLNTSTSLEEEPCSVTGSNVDARVAACEEQVLPPVVPQVPVKLTRSRAREMTIPASNTRSKKAKYGK
ncbi:unnamed protein product [Triticum turgidum subsp. durum]|uniref:CCHC-type domain-containing protein n=1 Tax=Triticum turgidum subsp. durum TaxID=4567 RepID=A0A9R1AH98_TRITD|nr:unnamed protein product [Triticum turgidum subsp. durum]